MVYSQQLVKKLCKKVRIVINIYILVVYFLIIISFRSLKGFLNRKNLRKVFNGIGNDMIKIYFKL
jgi:hypothetical protein